MDHDKYANSMYKTEAARMLYKLMSNDVGADCVSVNDGATRQLDDAVPTSYGGPMLLGNLVSTLEKLCAGDPRVAAENIVVAGPCPLYLVAEVDSYRGAYEDLYVEFTTQRDKASSAEEVLNVLRKAIGSTYTGYKGGNYLMGEHTRVHVALYGRHSPSCILGLADNWAGLAVIVGPAEWAPVVRVPEYAELQRMHLAAIERAVTLGWDEAVEKCLGIARSTGREAGKKIPKKLWEEMLRMLSATRSSGERY